MSLASLHVYFGGTFDPPHLGHHEMLQALLSDAWVECVHLVPTGINPLKADDRAAFGDGAERLAWVETWLKADFAAHLQSGRLKLETLELERPGPHYTVDTLAELRARHPNQAAWALCVGGDIPRDFHRWKDFARLFASLHSVWIFPRGQPSRPLDDMAVELRALSDFRVMGTSVREVSSTAIRDLLRGADASQKIASAPLPASVRECLLRTLTA